MPDDLATPDVTAMVAWLREQVDEDERVVREAKAESVEWLAQYGVDCALDGAAGAIRRFADPARVLREVEAKRLLVDLHRECTAQCYVVRVLALPYADRPGYREEWRP